MSGRPFEIVIDGKTMFCIAYEREHERRAALSGRLDRAPPVETPEPLERPRGRPSFDSIIEEAVELIATELETLPTVAARARRVLRVIAQTADAEDIPSRDTVERFLRDRPARQKYRQNSPQKSRGSTLCSAGYVMLQTLLKRLNGHADEVPSLAEELAQFGRARADTEAEVQRLQAERKQALLDDADDKTVDAIERKIERANVMLEKSALAESPLRERLAAASAAERARRWEAHVDAHRHAVEKFLVAAREAVATHSAVIGIIDTARSEGFEKQLATLPMTPNVNDHPVCDPHLLDVLEGSLRRAPRPPGRAPRAAIAYHFEPNRPAIVVRPEQSPSSSQHSVAIDTFGAEIRPGVKIGERISRSPPLPDDTSPLKDHRR